MRLRTVHINTETHWGGGEQQTLLLVHGLRERGHEAVLATRPRSPLGQRAAAMGIEVLPLEPLNEIDPRAIFRLVRLLRDRRPHIIHMHSPHALALGGIAARAVRGPVGVVSRRVARSIYRPHTLRLNWLKYRLGARCAIAVSEAVRAALLRDGLPPGMLAVVRSGVDPRTVEPWRRAAATGDAAGELRRRLGLPETSGSSPPVVMSTGSIERLKGGETLLAAAHLLLSRRDAVFVLLGEGRLRSRLGRDAARAGLADRFHVPGFREDALAWIAGATVFVQPSHSEGLGTAILDALLLERPVVASATGGIPEIIEHRRHGLLVPPGDPGLLAAAIEEILGSPELAGKLAVAGRDRVLEEFTSDRMVEGTVRVYRSLLPPATG